MKECFIITPIGSSGTETRRETDGLVASVLTPVLSQFDLEPIPAHRISETGSITRQIIKRLIESDLVIANLTDLNPNVMYEVGIRHCARKPLIVLAKEGTVLPFDLSDERTVFFRNDMSGAEELKQQLAKIIPKALGDEAADNPVYRVVDVDMIKLPEGTPDVSVLADKKFSLIEDQLEELKVTMRSLLLSQHGSDPKRYHWAHGYAQPSLKSIAFYVETSDDLQRLETVCQERGISYQIEEVYKDIEKFTANPTSRGELSLLTSLANKLGLKYA